MLIYFSYITLHVSAYCVQDRIELFPPVLLVSVDCCFKYNPNLFRGTGDMKLNMKSLLVAKSFLKLDSFYKTLKLMFSFIYIQGFYTHKILQHLGTLK